MIQVLNKMIILSASLVNPQGGETIRCQAEMKDGLIIWIATQHGHGKGKEVTYMDYDGNHHPSSQIKKWL